MALSIGHCARVTLQCRLIIIGQVVIVMILHLWVAEIIATKCVHVGIRKQI